MKQIKAFARKIADFQAGVFLSLFFFLLVPVFALIVKNKRKKETSTWSHWDIPSDTLNDVRKQY